jgi:hypothetical protein
MTVWAVCPTCEGEGKHVNPSIDSHGISREEFDEDPDFEEAYFSGAYDVTCVECKGQRVVPGCEVEGCPEPALAHQDSPWPDRRDHTSSEHYATCFDHLAPDELEAYREVAESYAEQMAEIRMGA